MSNKKIKSNWFKVFWANKKPLGRPHLKILYALEKMTLWFYWIFCQFWFFCIHHLTFHQLTLYHQYFFVVFKCTIMTENHLWLLKDPSVISPPIACRVTINWQRIRKCFGQYKETSTPLIGTVWLLEPIFPHN